MEDDEGVCFGSSALAAAAQAVLLIRWLLSQAAAAAACTGDQEVGAALPAAQSHSRGSTAFSGAPGPTPTPQSATDPDHHLLRVRLSSNWLILVFNAVEKLQF